MTRLPSIVSRVWNGTYERLENLELERLHHVMVEACFARAAPIALLTVAGHGDEDHPRRHRTAESPGDIVAVHARESYVEDDEPRLELPLDADPRGAVVG